MRRYDGAAARRRTAMGSGPGGGSFDGGLYCRADDRGDPVIQLSPPLICDQSHFDEIEEILRKVLSEAADLL